MDKKLKTFAARILEECEQEGFTAAELQLLPQELKFAVEERICEILQTTKINPR